MKGILQNIGRVLSTTAKVAVPAAGPLVETVLEALDRNAPQGTPEQQMAWEKMRAELTVKRSAIEAEVETKLAESETRAAVAAQETLRTALTSGDAYVRRATPTIFYAWLLILLVNYGFVPLANVFAGPAEPYAPVEIPWEFWAFIGSLMGFRIHRRSREKEKGIAS